jgi:hypothetical protein
MFDGTWVASIQPIKHITFCKVGPHLREASLPFGSDPVSPQDPAGPAPGHVLASCMVFDAAKQWKEHLLAEQAE